MRLGDVQRNLGDLQAALASHSEALQVARRLAEADETPEALRGLSLRLDRLGAVQHRLGDLQAALALTARPCSSTAASRKLTTPPTPLAILLSASEGSARSSVIWVICKSPDLYTESLQFARQWAEADDSPGILRQLSLRLDAMGDIQRELGDLQAALAFHGEALQPDRRLTETDDSPAPLRSLAVSLGKVGDIQNDLGDPRATLASYTEALQLFRRLAES